MRGRYLWVPYLLILYYDWPLEVTEVSLWRYFVST